MDSVGNDHFFLFSQNAMKNLLNELIRKKTLIKDNDNDDKHSENQRSDELISYNLKADNIRFHKKQRYVISHR